MPVPLPSPDQTHPLSSKFPTFSICLLLFALILVSACSSSSHDGKEEQISVHPLAPDAEFADTAQANSIQGNLSLAQIATDPHTVVLTGLAHHRLITVYKSKVEPKTTESATDVYSVYGRSSYESYESEHEEHFMPGIDLIHGYNLLNVAHYDLVADTMAYLFEHPVLVKSLYYPSFEQDSLNDKPINRDYYLLSVYDADTNQDSIINNRDLRRIYFFNASCSERTQLLPADYAVVRSQYDRMNDVMYLFARKDANHNGEADKKEPLHIFWLNLKAPAKATRMY